jgi:NAD-dependent SIR2 family protein deacetylase
MIPAESVDAHPSLPRSSPSAARLFVLTGAGVSTDSGIPGYRDDGGRWQRSAPITLQQFLGAESARRRYWARSIVGWPVVARAQPMPRTRRSPRSNRARVLARW